MTKWKLKRILESLNDHKSFDCRTNKSACFIEFFTGDSSWAPLPYKTPDSLIDFLPSFPGIVRELIDTTEITGNNGAALDTLVDAKLHTALREINIERASHLHTLQEIELTKDAHLNDLETFEKAITKLKADIEKEMIKEET